MVYKALLHRRSIRKFQKKPVEKDKLDQLLTSALLAPSSRNIRPWSYIAVDEPSLLKTLSGSKPHGASFIQEAPLAIVILGNPSRSDVWVEDTAVASTVLLLMADELGLSACWCQIRKREHSRDMTADAFVKNCLNIPDPWTVESIIAIGYAAGDRPPYDENNLLFEKLKYNTFDGVYQKGIGAVPNGILPGSALKPK